MVKFSKRSNEENLILGVAANKSDLASDKTISEDRGREYAKTIGAEFKSTSALLDNGGFDELIEALFTKYHSSNFNNMDATASLSLTISMEEKKGGCCGGGKPKGNNKPKEQAKK